MRLNPKEQEKLMLHFAGKLAEERKNRGLKLNYVESVAYISSELLEYARDGKTVAELMQLGTKILTKDDVMEGVADMVHEVQVEATFPDGTAIINILQLQPDEKITAMIPIKDFKEGDYLFMATKKGLVKKTPILDYANVRNHRPVIDIIYFDDC